MNSLVTQLSTDSLPFPLQCHTQQGFDQYHSEENQDRHYYSYDSKRGLVWLGVFDGHAGSATSEYVCSNVVNHIRSFLPGPPESIENLIEAITKGVQVTESRLCDLNDPSGTCLLLCCLYKEDLIVTNIGDSRALLCRKKPKTPPSSPSSSSSISSSSNFVISRDNDFEIEAIQLSNDHNVFNQSEAKLARYRFLRNQGLLANTTVDSFTEQELIDQIKEIFDGDDIIENGRLLSVEFTRSLGDFGVKRHCFGVVSPEPEISSYHLTELDAFLLLASDGVFVTLDNQTAIQLVSDSLSSPDFSPAELLVRHSVDNGSGDDHTALILDLANYRNTLLSIQNNPKEEVDEDEEKRSSTGKSRVRTKTKTYEGIFVSWSLRSADTPPAKRLKENPHFAIFEAHARNAQSTASDVHRIKSKFVQHLPVPYSGLSLFDQQAKHHQKVVSASFSYKGF